MRKWLRRLATNLVGLSPDLERSTLRRVPVPVDVEKASATADIEDVEDIKTTLNPIEGELVSFTTKLPRNLTSKKESPSFRTNRSPPWPRMRLPQIRSRIVKPKKGGTDFKP